MSSTPVEVPADDAKNADDNSNNEGILYVTHPPSKELKDYFSLRRRPHSSQGSNNEVLRDVYYIVTRNIPESHQEKKQVLLCTLCENTAVNAKMFSSKNSVPSTTNLMGHLEKQHPNYDSQAKERGKKRQMLQPTLAENAAKKKKSSGHRKSTPCSRLC